MTTDTRRLQLTTLDGIPLSTFNFLLDSCADLQRASAALVAFAAPETESAEALDFATAQEQMEMAVQVSSAHVDGAPLLSCSRVALRARNHFRRPAAATAARAQVRLAHAAPRRLAVAAPPRHP